MKEKLLEYIKLRINKLERDKKRIPISLKDKSKREKAIIKLAARIRELRILKKNLNKWMV